MYLFPEMPSFVKCPTCGRSTPDVNYCQYCGRPLYSCGNCRTAILRKGTVFCQECGAAVTGDGRVLRSSEKVSWRWWLLPLICPLLLTLPWVGGVVAWTFNRHRDPRKALNILWLGISMTIVFTIIAVVRLQY